MGKDVTFDDLRYVLEHRMLPGWFYQERDQLIFALIKSQGEFLHTVLQDLCGKEGIEYPYMEEMYHIDTYDMGEGVKMLKITMPEPKVVPACHCMYLLFGDNSNKSNHHTIEKEEPLPYLCSWDEESSHLSYGPIGVEEGEQVERILELFKE